MLRTSFTRGNFSGVIFTLMARKHDRTGIWPPNSCKCSSEGSPAEQPGKRNAASKAPFSFFSFFFFFLFTFLVASFCCCTFLQFRAAFFEAFAACGAGNNRARVCERILSPRGKKTHKTKCLSERRVTRKKKKKHNNTTLMASKNAKAFEN